MMNIFESFTKFPQSVHFDDWSEYGKLIPQAQKNGFSTEKELCSLLNINYGTYERLINSAIYEWRDATSRSVLHCIAHILNRIPENGEQIFPDLKWQTRALLMLEKRGFLSASRILDPKKGKKFDSSPYITINGKYARTVKDISKLNDVLRILYTYHVWTKNHPTAKKLPKWIYRGIRAGDLFHHDNMKDVIDVVWKSDKSHLMRRKEAIDLLIHHIVKKDINNITDGRILSFTASTAIAKYFSRGEGIILRVDPQRVDILTSEIHDEPRVGGADAFNGKNEREYIIRIPDGYVFTKEDIAINDGEYYIADQNPLCVALFDHDDKRAIYNMNGMEIRAKANWNNAGTRTSLGFYNGEDWFPNSRNEWKTQYGFDPLPTEKNLSEITNFKIEEVTKRY
jgi:hypothetical protein